MQILVSLNLATMGRLGGREREIECRKTREEVIAIFFYILGMR